MKINQIIREKRKELSLTQEQIADFLGVSTPAVNKWEKAVLYNRHRGTVSCPLPAAGTIPGC